MVSKLIKIDNKNKFKVIFKNFSFKIDLFLYSRTFDMKTSPTEVDTRFIGLRRMLIAKKNKPISFAGKLKLSIRKCKLFPSSFINPAGNPKNGKEKYLEANLIYFLVSFFGFLNLLNILKTSAKENIH